MGAGAGALDELRQHWQLAACTQFLLCFGRACDIEDVYTEVWPFGFGAKRCTAPDVRSVCGCGCTLSQDLEVALVQPLDNALVTGIAWKLLSALPGHRRVRCRT
jgi:hypothetical protein